MIYFLKIPFFSFRTIALGEVVKIKTVKGVVNTVIPVSGVEKKIEEKKVGEKKTEEPVILIEKNAEEKKEVEGN